MRYKKVYDTVKSMLTQVKSNNEFRLGGKSAKDVSGWLRTQLSLSHDGCMTKKR